MSKKKSLGSSPIGYSSLGVDSYEFIPSIDLPSEKDQSESETNINTTNSKANGTGSGQHNGLNQTEEREDPLDYESLFTDRPTSGYSGEQETDKKAEEPAEKKIVSYYLEEELVERLKTVADRKKMYYSTLVSSAIFSWLERNSIT